MKIFIDGKLKYKFNAEEYFLHENKVNGKTFCFKAEDESAYFEINGYAKEFFYLLVEQSKEEKFKQLIDQIVADHGITREKVMLDIYNFFEQLIEKKIIKSI